MSRLNARDSIHIAEMDKDWKKMADAAREFTQDEDEAEEIVLSSIRKSLDEIVQSAGTEVNLQEVSSELSSSGISG